MLKLCKRLFSLVLTFVLVLGLIGVLPTKVEAEEAEVILDVWEVSAKNLFGNFTFTSKTVSEKPSGLKTIKNATKLSGSTTFYDASGDYCFNVESNGNTAIITYFGYCGSDRNVVFTVPDKIRFHFAESLVTNEDKSYTINFERLDCYITGISTAFDASNIEDTACNFINLIVNDRVTSIDKNAFKGNTKLQSVVFKGDINTIEPSAFEGCTGLNSIDLSSTFMRVTNNSIPDKCFKNCTQLQNIYIPDTIISIGSEAFYGCNKLDTIKLTEKIEFVGKNAFAACSGLRYIYVESQAQDWSSIVGANEQNKLITKKITSKPIVAVKGTNNDLNGKYIYGASDISIFSQVDMEAGSVTVKKDGVEIPDVKVYADNTYGYKTNAYYFSVPTSAKGVYTITGRDVEGNTCASTFSYLTDSNDTTPPTIIINGKGSSDCYQEATVLFSDNETFITSSILNDKAINSGYIVKDEGEYRVEVKDALGNAARKTFIVDKTAPKVTGVENGAVLKKGIEISLSDNLSGIKTVTLNNKVMPNDKFTVYDSGVYTLVVQDKALNTTTVRFTIDSVGPTITGVINGKYYNADVPLKFNSISGIIEAKVRYTSTDKSVLDYNIQDGFVCNKDGSYQVSLKDSLGSSVSYKFTIDKTAPAITGVVNGKSYKSKQVEVKIVEGNIETATLNGKSFSKSKAIKDEGKYTLTVVDKAGNTTTVKFNIDRKKPKCTVKNKKTYKKGVKVWASDKVSGIKYVKLDKKKIKKATKVKKKGSHTLVVMDKAGNKTTVKFKVK